MYSDMHISDPREGAQVLLGRVRDTGVLGVLHGSDAQLTAVFAELWQAGEADSAKIQHPEVEEHIDDIIRSSPAVAVREDRRLSMTPGMLMLAASKPF